jgi:hypothetical protein
MGAPLAEASPVPGALLSRVWGSWEEVGMGWQMGHGDVARSLERMLGGREGESK